MNKKLLLVSSLLVLGSVIFTNNKVSIKAQENETTLKEEKVYQENFEDYNLSTTGEQIFNAKQFMWFESSHVDSKVVDYKDSKALEYMIIGSDTAKYSKLGGLGTSAANNLEKLIDGETYTLSMDITIETSASNATLFIEYQTFTWTGVKIVNGTNMEVLSTSNTSKANYVNSHLTFSFMAGKINGQNSYVTMTGKDFEVTDKIYVDNISISKPVLAYDYDMDFESLDIGTSAPMNNLSNIANVYNASLDSLIINGDESNHYLEASKTGTGTDAWEKFYFNGLTKLVSGNRYRLSLDVLEAKCKEFYICYNESGQPCVTYNQNGYVSKDNSEYIIGGSFDGTHLTFDFIPNVSKDANWWQQVAVVIKHSEDMIIKFDNVNLYNLDKVGKELVINTDNFKTNYYVGEELNLDGLKVQLKRQNESLRNLTNEEYFIDSSNFNKNRAGDYTLTILVVDEYGNDISKDIIVHVKDDNVVSCKISKMPTKLNYLVGESLNLAGLEILETHDSGKTIVVTSLDNVTINKFDNTKIGKQVVGITYLNQFDLQLEVTIYPSVIESFKNVQTQARLSFDYTIIKNDDTNEVRYSDFKNVSIDAFYSFDTSTFIDVKEIGVLVMTSNFEFKETKELPQNARKIINTNATRDFTYKIDNINDYKQAYYIGAYVQTKDGVYHFAKNISYSVATMLEVYKQDVEASYYNIVNSFYNSLGGK